MGGGPQYPAPKYVWSPAGGWWGDNPHWKRNTAIAFSAMMVLGIGAAMLVEPKVVEYDYSPDARPQRKWAKRGVDPSASQ